MSRPNGLRVEWKKAMARSISSCTTARRSRCLVRRRTSMRRVSKPGGIDEAVTYFLKDLHMRLPLAALLLSRFPAELESRTQSLDYVEKTLIDGMPTIIWRDAPKRSIIRSGLRRRATVTAPRGVDLQERRGPAGIQGTIFRLEPDA